jgi:hypothetical protein
MEISQKILQEVLSLGCLTDGQANSRCGQCCRLPTFMGRIQNKHQIHQRLSLSALQGHLFQLLTVPAKAEFIAIAIKVLW